MEERNTEDIKMDLLKRSVKHREELENEVRLLSSRTETVLTNALIIGGTLAASYLLVRTLTGRASKPKKGKSKAVTVVPAATLPAEVNHEDESPGILSQIGTALASQATVFLLGLAKEKLAEYLQGSPLKQENNNDRS